MNFLQIYCCGSCDALYNPVNYSSLSQMMWQFSLGRCTKIQFCQSLVSLILYLNTYAFEYKQLSTFVSTVQQKYECMTQSVQENKTNHMGLKTVRDMRVIEATFLKKTSRFYVKVSWEFFIQILTWRFSTKHFQIFFQKNCSEIFFSYFGQ